MRKKYGLLYSSPILIFMSLFFVVPLLIIFLYSFRTNMVGSPTSYGLDAYRTLFSRDFILTTLNTLRISIIAVAIALFIALPCAYFMVRSSKKTLLLFIIIIPFWTNFIVRVFAWRAILESNGFINMLLERLGLISEPIIFLYNPVALMVVLAYTYLPLMILPLYSTIDKFDFSLLEAARDLGCSHKAALRKIMIPNIMPGIYAAILFAFMPIFGNYIVPEMIGGGREGTFMLGQRVANAFFRDRNWAIPSAFTTLLSGAMMLGIIAYKLWPHLTKKVKGVTNGRNT
ncbi:MAG: ABC transporter permease [Spirochaetaceae bacterium]|nr:ABC transporter permease [Spirochaetaceae bacterium]